MKQRELNLSGNPIRDAISRIRFAPHSNNLVISSWDSSLRLYDADKNKLRLESSCGREAAGLTDCCFQSETVALSAASDGAICRHDLGTGVDNQIGNHDDLAGCVEFSDETNLVISGGWDKKIRFWDTRSAESIGSLDNQRTEVESISISRFQLMAAVGSSVSTYDLRNLNKLVQPKQFHMNIEVKCVRSLLGFEGFALGSMDGRVALKYTEINDGSRGYAFRCHPKEKVGKYHLVTVNDIAFSPSLSSIFATGDNEGYASLWDSQSKKRLYELPKFPNSIASLSYNHNGLLLAVASSYTYQEANEREEIPQIYVHEMGELYDGSLSGGSCK
ncbi:OLC1v1032682C1 [Oldenlandia corymbosa var. corymbosa]|uniref:OLC1v1032682C1 n=1 Tax=Oldenlandia corymbosa var. corymbosa TaxID=529605 RepID=A0AAV1CM65_OLDCO|nr:OLC1v1032682C1 [Oldenlandia corymbosa var. corymbosa]